MASFQLRAWSVLFACASLTVAACMGSVDREYFDDAPDGGSLQATEGGADARNGGIDASNGVDASDGAVDGGTDAGDGGADAADAGPTYKIGGTVVGLEGTGLVLRLSSTNSVPVVPTGGGANVGFTFPVELSSGTVFGVSIFTQPSNPAQSCSVSGGDGMVGSADITSVVVNCGTNTYTVGGMIEGLEGSIVLKNNGGNDLSLTSNGTFAFSTPVASGSTYAVTIDGHSALPVQTCTLTGDTGAVSSSNVTTVSISCTTESYTVGGSVSGAGGPITLTNNNVDDLVLSGDGSFTFGTPVLSNRDYDVEVKTPPPGKTCTVTSGKGTVTNANVSNVQVNCIPTYALEQNFDGVVAPALPAGWTSTILALGPGASAAPFATTSAIFHSAPNSAAVIEIEKVSDIVLTSPTFVASSSSARLSFRHAFVLEAAGTTVAWDGAVLEIAIDGGAFQDIVTAGGTWVAGGYGTKPISAGYDSTIPGRVCWTGNSLGFILTTVNLPLTAGQSAVLRWRLATDNRFAAANGGWRIDSIVVAN